MINSLLNPLIVYWDIDPAEPDDEIVMRICGELVDTGIFILDLRDMSPQQGGVTDKILERLGKEQLKIKLTTDSTVLRRHAVSLKGAQVFVEFDSVELLRSALDNLLDGIEKGYVAGVSFAFNSGNYMEFPAFISLCIDKKIENIRIPIQRAYEREAFYPAPDQALILSEALDKLDLEQLNLSIHDPFLWKMLYKKDNPNEDGCNAAKTMMYISGIFDVTPCPILPVSLGNLYTETLKEIFASKKREQIRKILLTIPPHECLDCKLRNGCKGGCRGRAYVQYGNFDKRDPACLKIT